MWCLQHTTKGNSGILGESSTRPKGSHESPFHNRQKEGYGFFRLSVAQKSDSLLLKEHRTDLFLDDILYTVLSPGKGDDRRSQNEV